MIHDGHQNCSFPIVHMHCYTVSCPTVRVGVWPSFCRVWSISASVVKSYGHFVITRVNQMIGDQHYQFICTVQRYGRLEKAEGMSCMHKACATECWGLLLFIMLVFPLVAFLQRPT